jgi:uncharacterized protein YaiE (UPF0345 family)
MLVYHGGETTDNLKIVGQQVISKEWAVLSTGSIFSVSTTKINDNRVAIAYSGIGGKNKIVQIFEVSASEAISDSTIKMTSSQDFCLYAHSYFTLCNAGENQLICGYGDADNSNYGTIEKIEVTS